MSTSLMIHLTWNSDFPKALWACTIAEIIVFSIVGGVIYGYTGNQYVTAPAFGSLKPIYKKAAFSFMIPTIIFLGCLYASVTARFVYFRIFRNSKHMNNHTVLGWASWSGILLATWILAFIIAQVIPFFNSRKSRFLLHCLCSSRHHPSHPSSSLLSTLVFPILLLGLPTSLPLFLVSHSPPRC